MVTVLKPASAQNPPQQDTPSGELKQRSVSCTNRLLWFQTATALCNVVLVALYAAQVYTPHTDCIVNDTNVTRQFDLAFRIGLVASFSELLFLLSTSMERQDPT